MSVVGFDFGNHKCVVSVARKRGIDVLQNEVGSRTTPTAVAFSGKQRLIGQEAAAQLMSNPKGTVTNFKRLLGRKFKELEREKPFMTYAIRENTNTGTVEIEVPYDDQIQVFSPEQITGALFGKLKLIAESGLEGMKVSDCCIACPPYFTEQQRKALLHSAEIAGLNVLKLMNDTSAVALNYGILRPLPKEKTQLVMFYDMGHSSTNCALVAFTEGKLTIQAQASDRHLGGRNFDQLLVDHFVELIKTKYKMDVTSNTKSMLKLRKECERVKLHLSANSKVQFAVEYIMNDVDVNAMIERSEFEALCQEKLVSRFTTPIQHVLVAAGISKEDLHSIEVVGGSIRVPIVQKALAEYLGRDISKTCDGDESVARGCALMCAMISPSFRVREFEVCDASPYAIELTWGKATSNPAEFVQEDSTPLFTRDNLIPSVKLISFNDRTEPFQLIARYSDPSQLPPSTDPVLGRFIVSGMTGPSNGADSKPGKIKVRVKLDTNGCLKVSSALQIEEIQEQVQAEQQDAKMDTSATDSKSEKSEKEAANGEAQSGTETPPVQQPDSENNAAQAEKMDTSEEVKPAADSASAASQPEISAAPVTKTKVQRHDLKVESFINSNIDHKDLQAWFEKEVAMAQQDRHIFETNETRNTLESYVLEMRNRLSGDLALFVKDEDRNQLNDQCNDAEEWVYGDGSDAQKSEYKQRLADLKKIGDQIVHRHYQAHNRDHHVQLLKAAIGHYQNWAALSEEKFAHIQPEDRQKIVEECNKADQWLTQQLVAQDKHPAHEHPLLTCETLDLKKSQLEKFCAPITQKEKPQPKPAPAQSAPTSDSKKEESMKDQQADGTEKEKEEQIHDKEAKSETKSTKQSPQKAASPKKMDTDS